MIPRRLVLDTSVLVAANRNRSGGSALLLYACLDGDFEIVATPALFLEYEAVLSRPEHGLTSDEVEELLQELADLIRRAYVDFQWRPALPDADDELVLEAAINGHADAIVTHNVRDFGPATSQFGIAVFTPGAIIKMRRANLWPQQ